MRRIATKDVTIRKVDSKIYEEFSAEAQRKGLSVGEAATQALQSWLTRRTEIEKNVASFFDPEDYKIAGQPIQIEFYESPTCEHCPEARRRIIEAIQHYSPKFIGVNFINVSEEEGLRKAQEEGLSSVPSIILKVRIVGVHPRLREKVTDIIRAIEA